MAIVLVAPRFLLTSVPYEVLLGLGAVLFGTAFQGLRIPFAGRAHGLGSRA